MTDHEIDQLEATFPPMAAAAFSAARAGPWLPG